MQLCSLIRAEFLLALLLLLSGCIPDKPKPRPPYEGPTLTLAEVVSRINSNNSRIKTLWANGEFKVWSPDEKGKEQYLDGDKLFVAFRKPAELKMAGEKFGAPERLFEVGTNTRQFWMWFPIKDTMWWGEYHGEMPVKVRSIPIRPDLLTEVFALNNIDPDLFKAPVPVLRFNNEERAYMVTFHVVLADRMIVQKEVWYDVDTLLPRNVRFYDPNGRLVLLADLSEHAALDGDKSGPLVATRYDLRFLQTHTKLVLKLRDVKASNKGIPNDRTFRFPGPDAAEKSQRVDEAATTQ